MSLETNPSKSQERKSAVICVFCASSPGTNPVHLASARQLAQALHAANASLVYGGGGRGIMGEVAKTLISLSGPRSVHGVIPRALIDKGDEDGGTGDGDGDGKVKEAERKLEEGEEGEAGTKETKLGLLTVVNDMHARKKMMSELVIKGGPGSGFVALAGGYGTVEEVMEMVTWNQLGIHAMPIVLVNINGYWDGLVQWIRNAVAEGFVSATGANILVDVKRVEDVVGALRGYQVAEGRYHLDWSSS